MKLPHRQSLTCKSACGGQARGRPAIVNGMDDLTSVRIGDILVAVETDIAFVPAMHRAGAIVTERGGRFCHAAVWARENNKPVVLQAIDATTIFRDVPVVFVNADNGVIEWEA